MEKGKEDDKEERSTLKKMPRKITDRRKEDEE
jgi:hypothetical protein